MNNLRRVYFIFFFLLFFSIASIFAFKSHAQNSFSYIITANWATVPSLNSFTTINVNLIAYSNLAQSRAYAILLVVFLPHGVVNQSGGNYVEQLFPLSDQIYQYNFKFNVSIVDYNLPGKLLFPVSLTLIKIDGNETTYYTSFSLPFYGVFNFTLNAVNFTSFKEGYNNVTLELGSKMILHNVTLSSPYFFENVTLQKLSGTKNINVTLFIPFQNSQIFSVPVTVSMLTPYGLPYTFHTVITGYLNSTSSNTLNAVITTKDHLFFPGYNNLTISIINEQSIPIRNATMILSYGENNVRVQIPYLSYHNYTNISLTLYINESTLLKIYLFFKTPLGVENVSLGNYPISVIKPILVSWNNYLLNVSNKINVTLNNVEIFYGEGHINIGNLEPYKNVLIPLNYSPSNVKVIFSYNKENYSYNEIVNVSPFIKLIVKYEFANISRLLGGKYSSTLIVYITSIGNSYAKNIYVVVKPNSSAVNPLFYVVYQLFPNETVALPFSVVTQSNTSFQILIFYYTDQNNSYIYSVNVNVNYVKAPLGAVVEKLAQKYLLFPVYGIPVFIIAFLLIIIILSIIPGRRKKRQPSQ